MVNIQIVKFAKATRFRFAEDDPYQTWVCAVNFDKTKDYGDLYAHVLEIMASRASILNGALNVVTRPLQPWRKT